MKEEKDALVALATFNEIENVPTLVERLLAVVPDADVLIVDDDSPDGTGRWALDAAAKNPRVKALVRTGERGLGTAVLEALKFAISNGYRRVVDMDADFSHPVEVVPALLARLDGETPKNAESASASKVGEGTDAKGAADRSVLEPVDVVIGSRYVRGGSTPGWPAKRRLASRCVNLFARLALGLSTRDNSGAFRCYRVETLRKLDFDEIVSTGYSFFEEILFRLNRVGARFAEIPIAFVDRRFGVSKINKKEAVKAVATMARLGLSRFFSRPVRKRSKISE